MHCFHVSCAHWLRTKEFSAGEADFCIESICRCSWSLHHAQFPLAVLTHHMLWPVHCKILKLASGARTGTEALQVKETQRLEWRQGGAELLVSSEPRIDVSNGAQFATNAHFLVRPRAANGAAAGCVVCAPLPAVAQYNPIILNSPGTQPVVRRL